jgi:predicted metal-dependent phosphotriesterase family hydrolase
MQLQTVTGMIPVEAVQLADGHAHAWIQPPPGVDPDCPTLNDYESILLELDDFRQAGGTLLVDCQPGGCGRDARMLAKLSQATGVSITAVTGFHLRKYYPLKNWLWQASETEAADHFVEELTGGMTETAGSVPATAIKIGYEGLIDGQFRALMEAAAEASHQTGAGLLFHTEQGHNVEALLSFFTDRRIPHNRLYFCHMDKRPDIGLHHELAQAGVLLGYDTFLRRRYDPEKNVWPLLKDMVENGHSEQVALGLDAALSGMWARMGGEWGLLALPKLVVPRLRHEGISEAAIAGLIGQNVARWLVWQENE